MSRIDIFSVMNASLWSKFFKTQPLSDQGWNVEDKIQFKPQTGMNFAVFSPTVCILMFFGLTLSFCWYENSGVNTNKRYFWNKCSWGEGKTSIFQNDILRWSPDYTVSVKINDIFLSHPGYRHICVPMGPLRKQRKAISWMFWKFCVLLFKHISSSSYILSG